MVFSSISWKQIILQNMFIISIDLEKYYFLNVYILCRYAHFCRPSHILWFIKLVAICVVSPKLSRRWELLPHILFIDKIAVMLSLKRSTNNDDLPVLKNCNQEKLFLFTNNINLSMQSTATSVCLLAADTLVLIEGTIFHD